MSFNFAAAAPAAGGFGFGFGAAAPAAAPAAGGFAGFGAAAPQPAAGGLSFGATTTTTAAPAGGFGGFGAAAKPTGVAAPLSFGGATSIAPVTATPSFGGFGTPASTAAAPLGFGAAAGAKPTGLALPSVSFGGISTAAPISAAPTLSFGGGFGAAAPAVATAAPAGLGGFGAPAASTAAPTLGFGGLATTAAAPAVGFGAPTSLAGGVGLGLGGTAPAARGFGLGMPATIASSAVAPVAATATVGLGGITNPLAAAAGQKPGQPAANGQNSAVDPKNLKETQIPNELVQTVEDLKKFVKDERSVSSDIAHISSKTHQKIKSDTEGLLNLVQSLSAGLSKNKAHLDLLKMDAAQELLNVEIAQRTKDTPPALQYENVAPYEYFSRIVVSFENQMMLYRRQIEETEQHLLTMATNQALSPDDITKAIEKLHGTFTNLAGKFQKLHEMCEQQKDLYIQLHRLKYGKNPDLFDKTSAIAVNTGFIKRSTPTVVGPSPFTGQQDLLAMAKASLSARGPQQHQQQQQQPLSTLGGPPPTYGLGTTGGFNAPQNNTLLGTPGLSTASQPGAFGSTMSPFQSSYGQQPQQNTSFGQNTSIFQTTGKRGKH